MQSDAWRETDRTAWKVVIVPKIMFGMAGRVCTQNEINWYESMQEQVARWLWKTRGCSGAAIMGETGFSSFQERESKIKIFK